MKALQEFLRPEFINRVDEIVYFNQLTEDNFKAIAAHHAGRAAGLPWRRRASPSPGTTALLDYLVKKSYLRRPTAPATCAARSRRSWRIAIATKHHRQLAAPGRPAGCLLRRRAAGPVRPGKIPKSFCVPLAAVLPPPSFSPRACGHKKGPGTTSKNARQSVTAGRFLFSGPRSALDDGGGIHGDHQLLVGGDHAAPSPWSRRRRCRPPCRGCCSSRRPS